ncbi:MAG: 8-amino-7-oxononanoate synthase [Myxococcota bacterium]
MSRRRTKSSGWLEVVEARNARIREEGRWRTIRTLEGGAPETRLAATGQAVVSFASNDYLGLSQHPALAEAAHDAIRRFGTGSGASRLVVGARPLHDELEHELAAWKGAEAALLFPTGFAANVGLLTALGRLGSLLVCSDALNHASIIDGARLSRADVAVYRHGDLEHLETLLKGAERALVVTDTVFSMDGDLAPVDALADLCARHGALLVLDEAHAVLGPETPRRPGLEVVVVGTLSKTLGSLGGFVAGPRAYIDLLVNSARPFIFTTATTPADAAAALAGLRLLRTAEGRALLARLRANVDRLRSGHPSPIVPVVLGDEARAVEASRALLAEGLLVPAIRPPTVAPGTSRLRVALSALHTPAQIDALAGALARLGAAP